MPQNQTISNLPEDTSVTIADYVAIVTPGLGQTRKAKLSSVLALATGGGAAPNYVGKYPSLAALQTDIPAGADGNYAIVAASPHDEEYIWDGDHGVWALTQNVPASTFALLGGNPTDNAALAAALTSASAVFSDGFTVNLPTNNTGIANGTVVNPGDPVAPFLKAAFSKASQPTVSVITNGNSQPYNQTGINLTVSISYTINTSGATLANITLERSRDNATWTTFLNTATATSNYADNGLNASIDNRPIYYRLTVTDSAGGTNNTTDVVNFAAYAAPGMTLSAGTTTRELGNISSVITGTITRNSPNIALSTYQVQYQINGTGSWINIGTAISASGSSQAINVSHNDATLINSTSIAYRVQVVDAQQTTTSGSATVSFVYKSVLGYDTGAAVALSTLLAMGNSALTNNKARTIAGVSATGTQYTYYGYDAAAGDVALVLQDGVDSILGAFTKLTDVSGVNSFGASVTMRVYRSNAPGAFTNSSLAFS